MERKRNPRVKRKAAKRSTIVKVATVLKSKPIQTDFEIQTLNRKRKGFAYTRRTFRHIALENFTSLF